jgi:hypothetical protein
VDLSELEVKQMRDPMLRAYEVELPRSKKKVRMKTLNGRGEEMISKAVTSGKDLISYAILARVESFEGRPPTLADLKSLSVADRNYLRDIWEDYEGGIDTQVEIQCPNCDSEYEANVNVADQGFFNPLAASKAWKKKSSS